MRFRKATLDDCGLLAGMNRELIEDEGHRNQMTVSDLEERLRGWLSGNYEAVVFEDGEELLGYGLFREGTDVIYLRQLFVSRTRRGEGIGRRMVESLHSEVWPSGKRLTVDVLVENAGAVAFWRAVGYVDYCLTMEWIPDS